jgi:hypothetical protein
VECELYTVMLRRGVDVSNRRARMHMGLERQAYTIPAYRYTKRIATQHHAKQRALSKASPRKLIPLYPVPSIGLLPRKEQLLWNPITSKGKKQPSPSCWNHQSGQSSSVIFSNQRQALIEGLRADEQLGELGITNGSASRPATKLRFPLC